MSEMIQPLGPIPFTSVGSTITLAPDQVIKGPIQPQPLTAAQVRKVEAAIVVGNQLIRKYGSRWPQPMPADIRNYISTQLLPLRSLTQRYTPFMKWLINSFEPWISRNLTEMRQIVSGGTFNDYPSELMQIPLDASEMRLPDMSDPDYYQSGAYFRKYLRDHGDERWKLPEPEFNNMFYNTNRNMTEIQKALNTASLDAFGAFAADSVDPAGELSVSPGNITGNSIIDALSGSIKTIGTAAAQRVAPRPTAAKPATTGMSTSTMLLIGGAGLLAVMLIFGMSRK